jgi:uncharacterized protein YqeY
MIKDEMQKKIAGAMKAGDTIRLETLKMLSAALTNAEIEKKREKLTKDEELAVVKKEAKKRRDAIDAYEKAGARQRAEKEKKELEILENYLPEEMPDEELEKIVDGVIKIAGVSDVRDSGRVIGQVMGKVSGRVRGERVAAMVKDKLSK